MVNNKQYITIQPVIAVYGIAFSGFLKYIRRSYVPSLVKLVYNTVKMLLLSSLIDISGVII